MKKLLPGLLALGTIGSWTACVGDDPDPVGTVDVDSGASSSGNVADTGPGIADANASDAVGNTPACDVRAPFGKPTRFTDIEVIKRDAKEARFTADRSAVYFGRNKQDVYDSTSGIFFATPGAKNDFVNGAPVTEVNSDAAYTDTYPMLSPDGLELVFASTREEYVPRLFRATRQTKTGKFGKPELIDTNTKTESNLLTASAPYYPTARGIYYFFQPEAVAYPKIYFSARVDGKFSPAGAAQYDKFGTHPVVTADEKTMYFIDVDGIAYKDRKLMVATRDDIAKPFSNPNRLYLDVVGEAEPSWVSPDGCELGVTYRPLQEGGSASQATTWIAKKPPLP